MKYDDLSGLWKKQEDLYGEWRRKLFASVTALKNGIEENLELKQSFWINPQTKRETPYITIINFYPERESLGKRLDEESISPKGELIFGIGLTFDHDINSFPKETIYIPVASRFCNNEIQYSYYDFEKEMPLQEWTSDISAFCQKQIQKLGEYLSHDPHSGFENKITMGFLGCS